MYAMFRLAIAPVAATAMVLLMSDNARAGMLEDCVQAEVPNLQINGCTAVIRSDQRSGKNLVWAYYNRGFAYHGLGEFQKAIKDYNRALRLSPNIAKLYNNRGGAFGNLGEFRKAIEDFDRALQLDPNYVDAYYNRGEAYRGLGIIRKAIKDYDRTIDLDPNDARAYHSRGLAHEMTSEFQRAVNDWETAMRLAGASRVRRWQEHLKKSGHYSGVLNGKYNAGTRAGLGACAQDPAC